MTESEYTYLRNLQFDLTEILSMFASEPSSVDPSKVARTAGICCYGAAVLDAIARRLVGTVP